MNHPEQTSGLPDVTNPPIPSGSAATRPSGRTILVILVTMALTFTCLSVAAFCPDAGRRVPVAFWENRVPRRPVCW
jgi:hypothetical protein